jgi:hypothetical protein
MSADPRASFLLLVGSGFSASQGGPDWKQLRSAAVFELTGHLTRLDNPVAWESVETKALERARKQSPLGPIEDYRDKPEFVTWVIGHYFGGARGLRAFLRRYLLMRPTPLYVETIRRVVASRALLVTTEFDSLFEQTLRSLYAPARLGEMLLGTDSHLGSRAVRVLLLDSFPVVVELHGSVAVPGSLVCLPQDVVAWTNNVAVDALAKHLCSSEAAVVWGYGCGDPDVRDLFALLCKRGITFQRTRFLRRTGPSTRSGSDKPDFSRLLGLMAPLEGMFGRMSHGNPESRIPPDVWDETAEFCRGHKD